MGVDFLDCVFWVGVIVDIRSLLLYLQEFGLFVFGF